MNAIGQRTAVSQAGTAFQAVRQVAWQYDSLGQVTSADSTESAYDRAYQFDSIGNRQKSADSLVLPTANNYVTNALNQYTSRSVGVSPTLNPEYDSDGNATAYPLPAAPNANSTLAWDAENRMISSTVGSSTTTYYYDAQSRRIAKTVGTATTLYLYDKWNVIAEYSSPNFQSPISHVRSYLWGLDLSGTLQGAGGVGGLLSESSLITSNPITFNSSFPTYDGNGNVSEYVSSSGEVIAHFEYDLFGNTVVNTDSSGQFKYRFSTKPLDAETGLYYYGYRYYDPMTGRWPSRDPKNENGGVNLYGFVGNDGLNKYDMLGLDFGPGITGPYIESPPNFGIGTAIGIGACKLLEFKLKQKRGSKPNDKEFHCVTSCEMSKAGGQKFAQLAGNLKECYAGQGSEADSAQDQTANATGRGCASANEDCKCCCKKAGY